MRVNNTRSAGKGDRRPGPDAVLIVAACAVLLAPMAAPLSAATVPTGYQEYFVIGREQQVWDMLYRVATGEGQTSFDNGATFINGMNSVVSATASSDNQVIYYDHWEDGYEVDLLNPAPGTTMVIGDGDPSNGQACDFTTDPRIAPCDGTNDDVLFQGSFVNFNSDQGLPGVTPNPNPGGACQGGLPAAPLDQRCSVPVNPRDPADIRFDGGDRIVSSGGPLSLLHPMDPLSPYIGGATEIISRQAVAAALSYSIPVGEDSYLGNDSVTEPFKYVSLDLVAFDDGTMIFIDSPGAGTVSFTLDQGQHYSSLGTIDDATAAPAITINEGTKVSTTGPITGMIFTGGDGNFAVRMYTLLPDLLHSTDYVITAPGDDPGSQGSRPLNLYILNPDPLTAITVTVADSLGVTSIPIPANSMVDYFSGTGRFVPSGSTVRLTSDRNFWGVSAYDHRSPANDWGHSWLARKFLTETYTVSFAPGVNNPGVRSVPPSRPATCGDPQGTPSTISACDSLDRSPIFASATLDRTQVRFDLDNDGLYDLVDTDGDDCPDQGTATDPSCAAIPATWYGSCGLVAGDPARCVYTVDAGESLRAYDFVDYDNSGTRIVANKPLSVAYGQDTDQATGPDPIQDTGYTIYPISQLFLDPVLVVEKEVSTTAVPTAGGTVTYELTVRSYDFGGLADLHVYDLLPPGVTGADYVPGSTLITYPDLSQSTVDPAASIDPTTGRDRLDWFDGTDSPDVLPNPITLGSQQVLTIQYDIAVPSGPIRLLTNEGHAQAELGGSAFSPFDTADVVQTDVVLTKSSTDDGTLSGGDLLTFTLTVENTGSSDESNVVVSDAVPPNTSFSPGSIVDDGPFSGTFDVAQNAVEWTAGTLAGNTGPFTLEFTVVVNPLVPAGTLIPNRGGYESVETPYFLSNEVEPVVVGPRLEVLKSGPALLHPNEVATYEIRVRNVGADTANNLLVRDLFPVNTTYVAGSMEARLNTQPFTPLTDVSDADAGTAFADRVELLLGGLGPDEDVSFRFRVRVNPGTSGLFVNNQATISSDEVLPTDTNLVQAPVVGDADLTGHVFLDLDGDGSQGAGEPDLANVDVVVTDSSGQTQIVTTDASGDWLATVDVGCYRDEVDVIGYSGSNGAFDWSATPWVEENDDDDGAGDPTAGDVQAVAIPAPPGFAFRHNGDPTSSVRALSRPVDLSTFTEAALFFDYRRVSLEAADYVAVEVSYDGGGSYTLLGIHGNGTDGAFQSQSYALDPTQLPNDQVVIRFRTNNFNFVNDEFYFDNVAVCSTTATVDVDESDPDFPSGAANTAVADPQDAVVVVPGGSVATGAVGYQPQPLTFTKTSDAVGGEAAPGQTITYTLEVTNYTATTQTGVSLVDPVPDGTAYVGNSVTSSAPAFRVSEYFLGTGNFAGSTYDLTLDQALAADYLVVVRGSDGDGSATGNRGPDENYAAVTADPFGTGDLAVSSGPDVLTLTRGNAVDDWVGVVTVVECVAGCDTAGFRLLDVQRVQHSGTGTAGTDTSGTAWTDLGRVMLMGGFAGAGCDTSETSNNSTNVCHVRLWPSGADTINWSRDPGGTTLSTATSTVMVVQWGSEWTIQRVNVTGTNGGDGVNDAVEYNTAAIASVPRAETWIWGTGHTDDNGLGDSAEGVVITLGDGVNQNVNETSVAVATEYADTLIDFEVWALRHPDLAVSQAFVADGGAPAEPDGDTADLVQDVTVAAATADRMALAYNSQNGTGGAFPRPIFSARYLDDTTVRMERRRSGQPFAAWVQGIDFDAIQVQAGAPPDIIVPTDGVTIAPLDTLTVTFQVVVDAPLDVAVTDITNTATLTTDQQVPVQASVTDTVVRPAVIVEPNNAGYAAAGETITYTHQVVNTGTIDDSFTVTGGSERGWRVELLDPDTDAVIAVDDDGDGLWDGGVVIRTGTLPPGGSAEYDVRVTVPLATPVGVEDTTRLLATSNRSSTVSASGTDETTVVGPSAGPGHVYLTPDNSGIVRVGERTAYSHYVINGTNEADTFDLEAVRESELPDPSGPPPVPVDERFTGTFHWDANGDGVYTPGTDLEISNTRRLLPGESQLIFYVVYPPVVGATPGDTDVAHLTAISRNHPGDDGDPRVFAAATDTTTVVGDPAHDLSGGGSVVLAAGDVPVHPGTLTNLGDAPDRYNLSISTSNLYGLDGLPHPTELWVDTDGDDTIDVLNDTLVAVDSEGDGTWETVTAGWDTDGDLLPDVQVAAGDTLAYQLRRPLDPAQEIRRDHVTLTSTSIDFATTDPDSVTATWIIAAASRAAIRGVRIDPTGEVSFVTATQARTDSFFLYQTDDPTGSAGREPLHDSPVVSPVPHSFTPILYRVSTRPVTKRFVVIEEIETGGGALWKGPFAVGDRRLERAFDRVEALMAAAGIARDSIQRVRGMRPLSLASSRDRSSTDGRADSGVERGARSLLSSGGPRRRAIEGVKILVHGPGRVAIPADALRAAGLPLRPGVRLLLANLGTLVPYQWEQEGSSWSLVFQAQGLSTDYSGSNVYTASVRAVPRGVDVPLTVSADPPTPGFTRVERSTLYVPSLPEGADPWQWDFLFSGWPWPDPWWDPAAGDFDIPGLVPGATGEAEVRIRIVGYTHHAHSVTATINGLPVGSLDFDGATEALLVGSIDASTLATSGNTLSLTYVGTDLPDSTEPDAMAYLDYVDLAVAVAPTGEASWELAPYQPRLPAMGGVEYLVVTHPLFRDQADRVAALKAAEGMRAVVVETESAYDRFSAGVVEPRAIQALIRHAYYRSRGALRFALLLGDDTFDPRDHVGLGSRSFVPSLFGRDASWGLVPSEIPYADVDDDGRPDIALGRLPVHTVQEADAVVDKIAAQNETLEALRDRQLVVADNASDTDVPFSSAAQDALALLPATGAVRWSLVENGAALARNEILEGWRAGTMVSHYFGHAGLTEWADEQVLTSADVVALGAGWKPTVLFSWACLSQYHLGIDGPALNEALLLNPGGGAVASFGPAGITSPVRQADLREALYRQLARPGIALGEAIRDARVETLDRQPRASDVIEGFQLFGDPSLQIPWPTSVPE